MSSATLPTVLYDFTPQDLFKSRRLQLPLRFFTEVRDKHYAELQSGLANELRPEGLNEGKLDGFLHEANKSLSGIQSIILLLHKEAEAFEFKMQKTKELIATLNSLKSKQVYFPFRPFPQDILHYILRLSAKEDGIPQARILSLVSSQVQHWVDPLLFSGLRYDNHRGLSQWNTPVSMSKGFLKFLSSPRFSQVKHRVSEMYIVSIGQKSIQYPTFILSAIPGLESLFLDRRASETLCSRWTLFPKDASRNETSLIRISNLHIYPPLVDSLLPPIPNLSQTLTQLGLYLPQRFSALEQYWKSSGILPHLRVLLLETNTTWARRERFVPCAHTFLTELQAPSLQLVLWRHHWQEGTSLEFWENAARSVHHPKLVFVVATAAPMIPVEKFWPFLQVPVGYLEEKGPAYPWGLGMHPQLIDQALDLIRMRREETSSI